MIKYYNRNKKFYEIEQVAGAKYLNWTYSSPLGMNLLELLIKKKLFSKIYGTYCDTKFSKNKINKFINEFNIDMSMYEKSNFKCFNDFFIRKLTKNSRPIPKDKNILISPCDGKVLAYNNIDINNLIQIKNITYKLSDLIDDKNIISKYNNGSCIVLRLCPTDYHRFHFIDDGICSKTMKINGYYYSVNPIALNNIHKLFCQNKREWSIFASENFKDVLYIEVGATCVGSIIQTYKTNEKIKRGDEKGYFKFGGSTVILFFKENTIKIDDDILKQTKLGYECSIMFGEQLGINLNQ
ncbi:phosphatidylserine decarboxylase [Haloimpatiens sp. FM7330]|uniref:phosphatidylserine decarboxylase n=1 Tax=Haloimpatiens sp. FM7330 TaxID=3298610 RepID=UPI00363EA547